MGRRSLWCELLTPVMERPGEWGLVRVYDDAAASSQAAKELRSVAAGRRVGRVPPGGWEFRSGQVTANEPRWGVWAKYLGATA
jgi:hypothetical protein